MQITNDNNLVNNYVTNSAVPIEGSTQTAALTSNNVAEKVDSAAVILELSSEVLEADGVVVKKSQEVAEVAETRASNQEYQAKLLYLEFYSGPIDGNFSSTAAIKAVKNFQRVYGLTQSGSLDNTTKSKLEEVYNFYYATKTDSDLQAFATNNGMDSRCRDYMAMTWTFLIKGMGLNKVQAAGAMGNIMHESRFSPTNAHDKAYDGMFDEIDDTNYDFDQYPKAAYGLMQWKFQARRDNLKAVATSMGLAVGDINAQFAAIRAESEDTNYTYNGWMTLRNMSSVSSATQVFKNQIEGCDDNSLSDRQAFASAIYSALI